MQCFPTFFVRGTLQGYFKWTRNPRPELPSKQTLFLPKVPLLRFRIVNKIMHNESNHKA